MSEKRTGQPGSKIDRAISTAEKDRFTVLTGFIYLTGITAIRAWMEGRMFGYASMNLYYYAWQITFFVAFFMGAVLVLSFLSGAGFRKACNITLFIFPIILLPPFLDYFMFGISYPENVLQYSLLTRDSVMGLLLPFSGEMQSTWGTVVQAWCVVAMVAIYLWSKTKSATRCMVGCLGLFVMALFMGSGYGQHILQLSGFRFPIQSYYGWMPDTGYTEELVNHQRVLFYTVVNIIVFLAFFWLTLLSDSKAKFRAFVRSVRGLRMLHGALMVIIGVVMVRKLDPGFGEGIALDPFYILHIPYIALAVMSVCFAWQFTTMLNDIYDLKIDRVAHPERCLVRGLVSESNYRSVAIMFGILACCTSAILGPIPFLLTAGCLALGMIYSMPPIRFREHVLGTSIIGMGSFMAYHIGIYSPGYWGIASLTRMPLPNADMIVVGLMILLALTLAPMLTQMRDYEGDMKAGVKSIFTVFGYEKGRRIVHCMVPMLFLLPLLVINDILDLILLPVLALAAYLVLRRTEDIRPVFATYFVAAVYSMFRILIWL